MRLNALINSQRSPSTRRGGAVAGCLIALAIVVVIAIIGVALLVMNWKSILASGIDAVSEQAITESSLPEGEKPELIAIIKDTTQKFRDGDIDDSQFEALVKKLATTDLWHVGAGYSADNGYLQASTGLTDDEKADGSVQLMRIAEGLYNGSIDRADYETVFTPIIDDTQDTSFEANGEQIRFLIFRDPADVTDDQLKEVIEAARTLADDNQVSTTPTMIDLSDAFQAEIDGAMAGTPESAPAEPEAPATDEGDAAEDAEEASTPEAPATP